MTNILKKRLAVAPMMEWTDRHCRSFHRTLTKEAVLYTEMVTTGALIHGDVGRHLAYSSDQHPVVLQLGGSEPDELAQCAELAQPQRSMLGAEQEQWLYDGMRKSQRTWKVLAQSTIIASTRVNSPLGKTTYTDAWDGYPYARKRLLDCIAQHNIRDVVTLGGDVHMNVASLLRQEPNDPSQPVVASEFVTTSISSRGMSETLLSTIRNSNPDLLHARSDERGYTLVDFSPKRCLTEFRTTPTPAGTSDKLKVQARFVVESGQPGPQAA